MSYGSIILVHIKSDYDSWKAIFDADAENSAKLGDDSRILVGKVDDKKAIV